MLSIVIATRNCARSLGPTLASLVPGAVEGIVSEVIAVDTGSTDDTVALADAAGCVVVPAASRAAGLRAAATAARARWLMFLRPGFLPEPHWTLAVGRFLETVRADIDWPAATFARPTGGEWARSTAQQLARRLVAPILRPLDPDQGLLISKRAYEMLGGHRDEVRDCETDLMRRIGRSRITLLACRANPPRRSLGLDLD
jgi:glycosyltransferase involved in cell wall biosynthesis